jgi:hypothetical protein
MKREDIIASVAVAVCACLIMAILFAARGCSLGGAYTHG